MWYWTQFDIMCLWNIPLHCEDVCHCGCIRKEAHWPIARLDMVRWENETKKILGRRKEESRVVRRCGEKQDELAMLKEVPPHGRSLSWSFGSIVRIQAMHMNGPCLGHPINASHYYYQLFR